MERSERIALGAAAIGHVALFAVLSFTLLTRDEVPRREAVAVTLSDDIGEFASAADRPAPAAERRDLDDDLDPMTQPEVEPLPQPSVTPKPPDPRPAERRTERRPEPRTQPERRPEQRRSSRISGITDGIGTTNDSGTSRSQAAVTGADRSNLISRIVNAVRPCYNLGSLSGTAAEDIVVRLRIQPDRDGSLSRNQVSVLGARGVSGGNRQYQAQMIEAARAAVLNPRCPLPPLPDALYENGWSDVVLNFIPAQLT
ncbi:cell envelope integrity protein TolA [Parasphingopyxis sp. CP4]|uniref:cell envelope integrity protein TolA n=1 Tax=Parasphingopyxis sp. CP4 TaxID=2724527 RepID=UPI0015A3E845|nr:cell envelope integrity protein TolA [Parasphingopyxis sp. CP4]QLC22535.1 cell envelope integrity protein TolA [Parasphingopyxis sp. CP4]